MAHNSQGSLLSATTQALERVILPANQTYSDIFSSIEEPLYLQAYGLTGDPESDYIALECAHNNGDGTFTFVDYAPAGVQRFNRLTNNAIIRERGNWRLRRVGNASAFITLMTGSNIHELPDDYWAERFRIGRGEGVTSVTGQNTPSVNLTAAPTTGAVNVFANVNISPDTGNLTTIRPNGLFTRGPNNGDIVDAITSVSDTNTIDHTLAANNLSSVVRLSGDAGNVIEARAGGLYVPAAAAAPIQAVTGSNSTTWAHDVTTVGSTVNVSGSVRFSPVANNQASDDGQGVWVPRGAGLTLDTSGVQTATFTPNVTLTSGVLRISGDARVSATAGNQITTQADGLYVAPAAAGVSGLTINDTQTVDFTSTGTTGNITASAVVKISPTAGNVITSDSGGIYAPTPVTSITFSDTQTIDFSQVGASGAVTANAAVKISATGGNIITANADGLYATAAGTVNATRVQTGITRFCTETQMRDVASENASDGGYTITTASLNHFIHCNNDGGFINQVRVGLPGFASNDTAISGIYIGNSVHTGSRTHRSESGGNVLTSTNSVFTELSNTVFYGGTLRAFAAKQSNIYGLKNSNEALTALHLDECNIFGDMDRDSFGDFYRCTVMGSGGGGAQILGTAIPVNYANFSNITGVWTVTGHGLTVGQYHVVRDVAANRQFVVYATDVNSLYVVGGTWSGGSLSGVTSIQKITRYENSTAIGHEAEFFASNQIKLGNANVTEVYSNAACVFRGNSFITISDERLKDIGSELSSENIVDSITPVNFSWKHNGRATAGFIAQDVEKALPVAVLEDSPGGEGYKSLDTTPLLAVLWAEVKSLRARVAELESR